MTEGIAKNAADLLQQLDAVAARWPHNQLESIVTLGESTGTTTLRVGRAAVQDAILQVGTLDTKFPDTRMRSALIVVMDQTVGVENSGYVRLFNVDESTGVHQLMSDGQPPRQAAPIDITGVGVIIAKADFGHHGPVLEIQDRINSGLYDAGATQMMEALLDPRPLLFE